MAAPSGATNSDNEKDSAQKVSPGDKGKQWRNHILATMTASQRATIFASLSPTAQAAMLTAMSEVDQPPQEDPKVSTASPAASAPERPQESDPVIPDALEPIPIALAVQVHENATQLSELPLEDAHGVSTGVPIGDTVSKLPWLCGTPGCTKPDKHDGCCDSDIRQGPRKRKRLEDVEPDGSHCTPVCGCWGML